MCSDIFFFWRGEYFTYKMTEVLIFFFLRNRMCFKKNIIKSSSVIFPICIIEILSSELELGFFLCLFTAYIYDLEKDI